MARPLRIEFPGALYHVMARGNARAAIFEDADDRLNLLEILGRTCGRFDWTVWAYCLMDNHYHLLVETHAATLSRGMREINGQYTQAYNRRHRRVGHVLQGRYKAVLVERDPYLLELSRYIVLNPVKARMVKRVEQWPWSNYGAVLGRTKAADWLAARKTLELFHTDRSTARRAYSRFVADGIRAVDPTAAVRHQLYLGSDLFVEKMADKVAASRRGSGEVPKVQRATKTLAGHQRGSSSRNEAIVAAYQAGGHTLSQIGEHFGLHYSVVSRIARARYSGKTQRRGIHAQRKT